MPDRSILQCLIKKDIIPKFLRCSAVAFTPQGNKQFTVLNSSCKSKPDPIMAIGFKLDASARLPSLGFKFKKKEKKNETVYYT